MNEGDISEYAKILLRNEDLDSMMKEVEKENGMASEVLDLHLVKTWKLFNNLHSLAEDNLDDSDEKVFEYNSEKFKCTSGKNHKNITIYNKEKRNKGVIAKIEVKGGDMYDNKYSVYSKTISIDKLDLLAEFSEELILEVNRAIVKKSKDTKQIEKANSKFVGIFGAIKDSE